MKHRNVIALISRIKEKANKLIIRELEAHGIDGLVPSHGDILTHLFTGEAYTMKDLAEKIHRTKPTVTVLVDKLVDSGYVTKEKSHEDSRVTFIKLTEKGFALKPHFDEISERLIEAVYQDLTYDETEFLEEILEKINRNLNLK